MKPAILVIHYSQSGQLTRILQQILQPLQNHAEIEWVDIKPVQAFPFPWTAYTFFDCMPECVLQIPEAIEPMTFKRSRYDLIVLGYQPWFLSLSLPFNSFLQSPYANILNEHDVLTVAGTRNMWLHAQEQLKSSLTHRHARLRGHVVLSDKHGNLTSVLSIMRWTFWGKKEAGRLLPEAGVSETDIQNASVFGDVIHPFLQTGSWEGLHGALLNKGSIRLQASLIILERRGIYNFRKFANRIHAKGERGHPARKQGVRLFGRLLFIGIFILSPISGFTARISTWLQRKQLQQDRDYFRQIGYREKAL